MARVLIVDDTDIVRQALEGGPAAWATSPCPTSDAIEALAIALREPARPGAPRLPDAEHGRRGALRRRCASRSAIAARRCSSSRRPRPTRWRSEVERVGQPAGFVRKPFHLDDLARVVADALAH